MIRPSRRNVKRLIALSSLVAAFGAATAHLARLSAAAATHAYSGDRLLSSSNTTEHRIPTPHSYPVEIVTGPDGALWFTESSGNNIGRITTNGQITEYPVGTDSSPYGIAIGPDGALWFTEDNYQIGRITAGGQVTHIQCRAHQSMASPLGRTGRFGSRICIAT